MDYTPIIEKIQYWIEYDGVGDEYRKKHDLDCILADGNLLADTIFSLWLPLRYTLNYFESPRWTYWKMFEQSSLKPQKLGLKDYITFLKELERDIEIFLPKHPVTEKLSQLFLFGQKRCNVMILPRRHWNSKRGSAPFWDYLPHFLYNELTERNSEDVVEWVRREKLTMLFEGEIVKRENLIDLAGTGDVCSHAPTKIVLPLLLENYLCILKIREKALNLSI